MRPVVLRSVVAESAVDFMVTVFAFRPQKVDKEQRELEAGDVTGFATKASGGGTVLPVLIQDDADDTDGMKHGDNSSRITANVGACDCLGKKRGRELAR